MISPRFSTPAPEHQYVHLRDPATLSLIEERMGKQILECAAQMFSAQMKAHGKEELNRPLMPEERVSGKYASAWIEEETAKDKS